jgi:hypothetical protein
MSDICMVCGCTEENPCMTKDGPCHWVMKGLCSACCIEIPPGENCFVGQNVGLILPKQCRTCAFIKDVAVPTDILKSGEAHTCGQARFVKNGVPQWYAWSGITRPNKVVAAAQKRCPSWEPHLRYKAPEES